MEADGTYEGRVSVQHGDEVVDSVNYRSKFLNYKACNSTQTFTATKNLDGGLTAQTITANLLKVGIQNKIFRDFKDSDNFFTQKNRYKKYPDDIFLSTWKIGSG